MSSETTVSQDTILTAEDAEIIAHLEPCAATDLLAEKLDTSPFEGNGQQKALYISYIYGNIMYASEKGFPWDHVCCVTEFAEQYLKKIIDEEHQFSDTIKDLKGLTGILSPLSDRHKKQYIDFVCETVLCHYTLYKYVFSRARESMVPEVFQTVVVPLDLPALSEGEEMSIWEYRQKVKVVEAAHAEARQQQQEMKEQLNDMPTTHKTLEDLSSVPLPYTEMTLNKLINDILAGYIEKKESELKMKIDEVVTDLDFKFQISAIERPAALAPQKPKSSQDRSHKTQSGTLPKEKGTTKNKNKSANKR